MSGAQENGFRVQSGVMSHTANWKGLWANKLSDDLVPRPPVFAQFEAIKMLRMLQTSKSHGYTLLGVGGGHGRNKTGNHFNMCDVESIHL